MTNDALSGELLWGELCQRCANDTVYVEALTPSIRDVLLDCCECRCGKCGWRFQIAVRRKPRELTPADQFAVIY
jgi:hypothetical protein